MNDPTLIEKTRAMYKARSRQLTTGKVATDTGLPKVWLEDFSYGRTDKPRLARVQALHDYLQAANV